MAGKKKKKGSNTTLYLILGTIGLVFVYLWFGAFKAHEVNRAYGWLSADTIKYCLQYPLEPIVHPVKEAGMYLLLIIVFGGFAIFFTINNQRPKDDGPNVKGDAHFMTPEEIHTYDRKYVLNPYYGPDEKTVDDVKGDGSSNGKQLFEKDPPKQIEAECRRQACIVSSSIFLSFDNIWSRKNTNALIVGTAGSGKSRYYVGPNILQCNTNYIITDPSGDLFSQYAKYLENNGYDVKKLDLEDMYNSERYKPVKPAVKEDQKQHEQAKQPKQQQSQPKEQKDQTAGPKVLAEAYGCKICENGGKVIIYDVAKKSWLKHKDGSAFAFDSKEKAMNALKQREAKKGSGGKQQAQAALPDDTVIAFGKFKGKKFGDIKESNEFKEFVQNLKDSPVSYGDGVQAQVDAIKALAV